MSDAIGFPGRPSFDALGGTKENRFPVTFPLNQLDLRALSAMAWQTAGLGKTGALVSLVVASDGTKISGGEAWNSTDEPSRRVTLSKQATGHYRIVASASYTDWSGVAQSVVFYGALISTATGSTRSSATYEITSATQVEIYTFNAAGSAADMGFTVELK